MKILIVEDDTQLNLLITKYFQKSGSNTIISLKDGLDAIDCIDNDNEEFDLFVIDINLPNVNGLDIVSHIRTKDISTPIIIITASLELENIKTAYKNGCNEYLKKPFYLEELDIRVKKLMGSKETTNNIYFTDDFYYDNSSNNFYHNNQMINLRYKEKRFLELLIENINNVVLNDTIYTYVWEDESKDSYPLRQLVNSIRKKLPYDIIRTKVKEGYIIETKK